MPNLAKPATVKTIITEISSDDEKRRRAEALKRHDIYRDGGKRFLIEQIEREFSPDAVKEMRLAPINLLKKIINKRSSIYKNPPQRITEDTKDQALVDYYSKSMGINQVMTKANRYFNLFSNTAIYPVVKDGDIGVKVVPSYLYSIVPNKLDQTKVEVWVFNAFTEEQEIFQGQENQNSATGSQRIQRERNSKARGDLVASDEFSQLEERRFIFWSDELHFTTDSAGNPIALNPELGPEQFINPFGTAPVVHLTKDRDNEIWAKQGEDLVDLTMAIQAGWSDMLSIAKEQGFSLLTVKSEEEPTKLTVGLNRAIWLKQKPDGPNPEIGFETAQSNLGDYNRILMDLLGLLLSTNDMKPNEVSGSANPQLSTSGFQELLEMSSTLEAIESDKPFLRDAELELWEDKIKVMHNVLHDSDSLSDEAKSLGKFSEDFSLEIIYSDIKPIESEAETQKLVLERMNAGLMTQKQALAKLNPELSEENVEGLVDEIKTEKQERMRDAQITFGEPNGPRQ